MIINIFLDHYHPALKKEKEEYYANVTRHDHVEVFPRLKPSSHSSCMQWNKCRKRKDQPKIVRKVKIKNSLALKNLFYWNP